MQLSDDKFKDICEKISQESYKFFKRKIKRELESLSKGNLKLIDENTIVNVVITSLALLDGNMMIVCKNMCKNLNMKKVLASHQAIFEKLINENFKEEELSS